MQTLKKHKAIRVIPASPCNKTQLLKHISANPVILLYSNDDGSAVLPLPLPGTTQMAHMVENTGATDVRFTPSEMSELNSAVRAIEVKGQRLPDAVLAFSGVEAPMKG